MGTIFVLIMTLGTPTGTAIATAEFTSLDHCTAAGLKWRSSIPARMDTKVNFTCVEK